MKGVYKVANLDSGGFGMVLGRNRNPRKFFHHFFAKIFAWFIFYHVLCSTKFFLNLQEWKTKR